MTVLELEELELVHMVKEVKLDKGLRYATVRCGTKLPGESPKERQTSWSVWETDLTCEECFLWVHLS